ncbi:hypothetical protein [Pseudonocardia asaccharolytica]|uniref:hypothetical protein n=1 Tax=Pseudonocardia asaccharolytica TaxID=54010 RepID=UPI00041CC32E|nr:hypothetical protein [Pseudonocardia asaccharolytica]
MAIVDPDDQLDHYPDQLVLVIGARGREADRLVGSLARRGAAAVAVKGTPRVAPPASDARDRGARRPAGGALGPAGAAGPRRARRGGRSRCPEPRR